jgi:hypothetical protein
MAGMILLNPRQFKKFERIIWRMILLNSGTFKKFKRLISQMILLNLAGSGSQALVSRCVLDYTAGRFQLRVLARKLTDERPPQKDVPFSRSTP